MRKIIFTRPKTISEPEGGLSITTPARNSIGDEGKTDLEIEERAMNKLPRIVENDANGNFVAWHDPINPKWIEESDVPLDRTFRNALEDVGGKPVHSLPKAKLLAHDMRRKQRDEEMQPHDDIVIGTVPGDAVKAEAERVKIRAKYDVMQISINNATSVEQLKAEIS